MYELQLPSLSLHQTKVLRALAHADGNQTCRLTSFKPRGSRLSQRDFKAWVGFAIINDLIVGCDQFFQR